MTDEFIFKISLKGKICCTHCKLCAINTTPKYNIPLKVPNYYIYLKMSKYVDSRVNVGEWKIDNFLEETSCFSIHLSKTPVASLCVDKGQFCHWCSICNSLWSQGIQPAEIDLEWFLPKNSIWSPMLSTLIHLAGSLDTSDMNSKNLLVLEAKHCSQIIKRDKTFFRLFFTRFSLWSNFFFHRF